MFSGFIVSLSVPFLLIVASASLDADTLDGALNHLDRVGLHFEGMSAQLTYVKHTALVPDQDVTSTGEIKIKRPKSGQLRGLIDFLTPDKKSVALNGSTASIYLPKMKTVQQFDLGKHKLLLEYFFLLGFGTSRRALEAEYSVSYGGAESVSGGPTTRIFLVSKNPDVRRNISKFELWISDKTGEPIQQNLYEPNGDYNVLTYSGMKVNPKLSDAALTLKHPKDVKAEIMK